MLEFVGSSLVDFFVSYVDEDRSWAEWIAWQLEEAGYRVLVQAWDFRPGSDLVVNMRGAAVGAQGTIAVLSPAYLASGFGIAGWTAAFAADPKGETGKLVPVRVADVVLEGLDRTRQFIDLVGASEDEARGRLLAGVEGGRAKPGVAPLFPSAHPMSGAPRFPAALPGVWNVPYRRNPNFTGRDEILDALAAAASSGGGLVPWAIVGLAGMGKSQLAAEYAYRHARDFDVVWWLRAEDPATAVREFAGLGGGLGLVEEADVAEAVSAVRACLEGRGRWLVVVDSAAGPDTVTGWLPRGGAGQILITAQGGDWAGFAHVVELGVLDAADSIEFLRRRSGDTDTGSAGILSEELGCLPLALEQAAAFVAETPGLSLAGYVGLFRDRAGELLARGRPREYPATVATTWSLAFEVVEERSPLGAALLRLCSFLGPDSIPVSLLTGVKLPEPAPLGTGDPLAVADALRMLGRFSLVRGTAIDAVAVHRLVQMVVRDRLGRAGRARWAATAVSALQAVFPVDTSDARNLGRCAVLLPHVLAATGHAQMAAVEPKATRWLLERAAVYLLNRAQFAEAKALHERSLVIAAVFYGPDHPEVASTLGNLGNVYQQLADLPKAIDLYRRALAIFEAAYGPDDPQVAGTLGNLGNAYRELADYVTAVELLERALHLFEAIHGSDDPQVAMSLNDLGIAHQQQGDLGKAINLYQRSLKIFEEAPGRHDSQVANTLGNLANAYRELGDSSKAVEYLERVLESLQAVYGPDHPRVALSLTNLGIAAHQLGDDARAVELLERALVINEAFYGTTHPQVAITLGNLGGVRWKMADTAEAIGLLERALAVSEAIYGHDHPYTARVRTALSEAHPAPGGEA